MNRDQRFPIQVAVLGAALLLAACGGGGGGHAASGPSPSLGTRSVPGGSIAVAQSSPISAGGTATLRVTVALPTAPSVVRAGIGAEYDADDPGVVATAVAGAPGQYDATVPVPTQLPAGSRAWVRVVLADGSIVESGTSDFLLR